MFEENIKIKGKPRIETRVHNNNPKNDKNQLEVPFIFLIFLIHFIPLCFFA